MNFPRLHDARGLLWISSETDQGRTVLVACEMASVPGMAPRVAPSVTLLERGLELCRDCVAGLYHVT